jgi:ABC-type Fe3+/spermidine/putrescine transport system ATPase subunit
VTDRVPVLELSAVRKAYPGTPPVEAVRGVSLTFRSGELAVVVGPSGSGKTTLLHLMAALDRPTEGSVHIAGRDIGGLTDRQLSGLRAHRIGVIFQQFFLIDSQTALDNVNLLTVTNGQTVSGQEAELPATASGMIGRVAGVTYVAPTAELSTYGVYRTDKIPAYETNGLDVRACDPTLLATLGSTVHHGTFLNTATSRYPVAALGYQAARALGIARLDQPTRIWLSNPDAITGRWLTVIGILSRFPLAPEIDTSVLVGLPLARQLG